MSKPVVISDHAIVRWLEHGIDLAFARTAITAAVQSAVNLGAGTYSLDGMTYVLNGQKVVTIIEARSPTALRRHSVKRNGYSVRVQR